MLSLFDIFSYHLSSSVSEILSINTHSPYLQMVQPPPDLVTLNPEKGTSLLELVFLSFALHLSSSVSKMFSARIAGIPVPMDSSTGSRVRGVERAGPDFL